MISLYVDGTSWLHRCPAGAKLLVLAVLSLALMLTPLPLLAMPVALLLAAVAAGYLVAFAGDPAGGVGRGVSRDEGRGASRRAGRGARLLGADLRGMWLFYAVLLAFQLWLMPWGEAVVAVGRVMGIVLCAQLLTRTTRVAQMVSVAEALLAPVLRVPGLGPWLAARGVRPERVGLAMGLVLSAVGHLTQLAAQVRQAQASRGVRMAPWAWILPLLVLSLKHADDVQDALAARGVE